VEYKRQHGDLQAKIPVVPIETIEARSALSAAAFPFSVQVSQQQRTRFPLPTNPHVYLVASVIFTGLGNYNPPITQLPLYSKFSDHTKLNSNSPINNNANTAVADNRAKI
jgi:hypothetical protein